jgi:hypothetical protein
MIRANSVEKLDEDEFDKFLDKIGEFGFRFTEKIKGSRPCIPTSTPGR